MTLLSRHISKHESFLFTWAVVKCAAAKKKNLHMNPVSTGGDVMGLFSCVCCARCAFLYSKLLFSIAFVGCVVARGHCPLQFSSWHDVTQPVSSQNNEACFSSSSESWLSSMKDLGLHHHCTILTKLCCGEHMFSSPPLNIFMPCSY